jgi:glycosyltransferase involved in cell wall biosynthesis
VQVAILVKEFPPDVIGGTETQTKRLAGELQARTEHEVTVFTKSYPSSADVDVEYEVVRVPNWHLTPFVSTLTFVLSALLLLLLRYREFDVLQSMMIYPTGFVGYLCSTIVGLPYFAWIRGGDYYFMKENAIKRGMIRRVLHDTLVLVQTEGIRTDVAEEFPQSELRVLGNGVDLPDATADGKAVIFVGRLEEQKGVNTLIDAMAGLHERLVVVGDGSERDALEARAADRSVDVDFVGEVPPEAVTDHLLRAQLFVLPSTRGEGLPNAVLEAMAVGLPVVGTDTGGVADAIVEGETGYVVDPGDTDALGTRITELCSDDEKRQQMSKAARTYIREHHDWQYITSELDDVYREIVDRDTV